MVLILLFHGDFLFLHTPIANVGPFSHLSRVRFSLSLYYVYLDGLRLLLSYHPSLVLRRDGISVCVDMQDSSMRTTSQVHTSTCGLEKAIRGREYHRLCSRTVRS